MKNKAIESLIRIQHNLPDTDKVNVTFKSSIDNKYCFRVIVYSQGEQDSINMKVININIEQTSNVKHNIKDPLIDFNDITVKN